MMLCVFTIIQCNTLIIIRNTVINPVVQVIVYDFIKNNSGHYLPCKMVNIIIFYPPGISSFKYSYNNC